MLKLLTLACLCCTPLCATPCIHYSLDGIVCSEYQVPDNFFLDDTDDHIVYYKWDNLTPASYDAIADDPLLAIRTKLGKPDENYDIMRSWANWTRFPHFSSPVAQDESDERLPVYLRDSKSINGPVDLVFDHVPPEFNIPANDTVSWQISNCSSFDRVIPSLNRQEVVNQKLTIDPLAATFLNPDQTYFFRYKINESDWTAPVSFKVLKPKAVDSPYFESDEPLKISWEAEPDTRYWIFASNAIDFVPEIYSPKQLNGIDKEGHKITAANANLLTITQSNEIEIDDTLCFYRIIAERNGAFSTPSPLIYVFSRTQLPQRTALLKNGNDLIRKLFPLDQGNNKKELVPKLLRAQVNKRPAQVPKNQWVAVQPWIMPTNHAARATLDRIFSKHRVLKDAQSLEKAGFTNNVPDSSQTIVTSHPKIDHYIMKLYLDSQTGLSDWQSWINRASGADAARNAIREHKFYDTLVAPYKWIYPLPAQPAAAPGAEGKNFILVADKMPLHSNKSSLERWHTDMNKSRLDAIYVIIQELGIASATTPKNLPWERFQRNVFINFERHNVWPTGIENLIPALKPELQSYMNELIQNNGP